ncbi:hypothetical protein N9251_03405, partial [Gammaproteobacteria bacterium]|nr:hypothetical protein [Gammaproteobacteria bacterium]
TLGKYTEFLNMREINWKKITVSQYYILQERIKGIEGSERLFKAGCILQGLDADKEALKGVDRFFTIANSVAFLGGGEFEPKNDLFIGGKQILFKPAVFLSGNEFMDIQNIFASEDTDLDKTINIFARLCAESEVRNLNSVDAHVQNRIVAEWRKHVTDMSMHDFFCLESFFLTNGRDLQRTFLQSLVRRINASTKMMMKRNEQSATGSKAYIRFLQTLRKKIHTVYIRNYRNLLALRYFSIRSNWNNEPNN